MSPVLTPLGGPRIGEFESVGAGGAVGGSSLPPNLSIDELVEWMTAQLSKTDSSLQSQMDAVADQKKMADNLNSIVGDFNSYETSAGNPEADVPFGAQPSDPNGRNEFMDGTYKQDPRYQSLPPDAQGYIDKLVQSAGVDRQWDPNVDPQMVCTANSPGYLAKGLTPDQAIAEGSAYRAADGTVRVKGSGTVQRAKLDDAIKSLNDVQSTLTSDNETVMIQLQSAVAARSRLIEMTSDIVKSINDTAKATIQNMVG